MKKKTICPRYERLTMDEAYIRGWCKVCKSIRKKINEEGGKTNGI